VDVNILKFLEMQRWYSKARKMDIDDRPKIQYTNIRKTFQWHGEAGGAPDFPSRGMNNMMTVEELELAVNSLTPEEYGRFRRWFLDRDWDEWDREIEEDVDAGRLDFLVREAIEAKNKKRLTDL
jgi:hypothetical protein